MAPQPAREITAIAAGTGSEKTKSHRRCLQGKDRRGLRRMFRLVRGTGRWPAQQLAGGRTTRLEVMRVAPAQMQDAIAVAAQPLEVAIDLPRRLGEAKQHRVGKLLGQCAPPAGGRHGRPRGGIETAIDETRRHAGRRLRRAAARRGSRPWASSSATRCRSTPSTRRYRSENCDAMRGLNSMTVRRSLRGIVEELHVEQAMREADRLKKSSRHIQRPCPPGGGQRAGITEAHEGLRAGIHHRFDDAQRLQLTVEDVAIEVVLRRRDRPFQQHAVGAAGGGQSRPGNALEGLDQMADHPQFPGTEADQRRQLVAVAHRAAPAPRTPLSPA